MAGLDNIKNFDGGGSVDVSSVPLNSASAPQSGTDVIATSKPTVAKGPYALGQPLGPTGYDPQLLENMQKLINEKQAEKDSFLSGLKDATAWWSGGVAGPAEALQNRAAEKDRQDAELFGMKSQLSQAKIGQELVQQRRNSMLNTLNQLGGTQGGGGGGGGTAAGYNPDVLKRVGDLYNQGQYDLGDKVLNEHLEDISKINRTAQVGKDYWTKSIEVQDPNDPKRVILVSPDDINKMNLRPTPKGQAQLQVAQESAPTTGAGGYHGVAADVNNPTGIKANGGFKTYDTPQAGVADTQTQVGRYLAGQGPMQGVKATPENIIGTWITGNAADGSDPKYANHVNLVKTELQKAGVALNADGTIPNTPQANAAVSRAKIIGESGQQNAAKFLPHVTATPTANLAPAAAGATAPVTTPAAAAPVAGGAPTPVSSTPATNVASSGVSGNLPPPPPAPPAPISYQPSGQVNINAPVTPAMKNQADIDKANAIEGGKVSAQNLGKEEEKLLGRTEPAALSKRAGDNDYLKTLINKWGGNSNIAGVLNDPGWSSAIATAMEQGINTPLGSLSMPAIVDVLQRTAPHATKEEIEASREIARVLGQRIFDVVQQSKGSSSDRDWIAFKQIAGSSANGWDALQKMQKYDEAAIDTDKKDRALYNKTFDGNTFNYAKHSINPERTALYDNYSKTLRDINQTHYVPTKTPPRPSGVPAGAKYSPSQKIWGWFDQNGKWTTQ